MPTCFERAVAILNTLGPNLPQNSQAEMSAALAELQAAYRTLQNPEIAPIDYSAITTQAAYIFRYLGANADLVRRALALNRQASERVLNRQLVRIVSVGGGPGTELVGLYKFIETFGCRCQAVEYIALDHHNAWQTIWPAVISTQPATMTTGVAQIPFSLHGQMSAAALAAISAADILTFSYALSESWRYGANGEVADTINRALSALPAGALVLYSDNGGPNFDPHLDVHFSLRQDFIPLGRDRVNQMVGHDEQASVLNAWKDWINNGSPKLRGDATMLLMEKRA